MRRPGAGSIARRSGIASLWRKHRARWTLPLVIVVIIGLVAIVDDIGSYRIRQVDAPAPSALVDAAGGSTSADLDQPWAGLNPNTPAGAASSTTTLLSSVLPSAYVMSPKLVPEVNSNLLLSVEATSTTPLTIRYVINPKAVWSDGVPVSADDFVYAWRSQRGDGTDIDGAPDQVASTLGYRDVASVTPSQGGKTVTVTFARPFTDWRVMFNHMVPAHIARGVGWNRGFDHFDPRVDLSAGPLVLHSMSGSGSTGSAVLVRNPKWWGTPAILRSIDVRVAQTTAAWSSALGAGDRSVAQADAFDLATVSAVTSLPNTQSQVTSSLAFLSLEFNVASPLTDRLAVRQGLAHLVDRDALRQRVLGDLEPNQVVNDDHLAAASQSAYNPSSAAGEYSVPDRPTADRLLRSAGYHPNPSGQYVDASGAPLTVRMAVEEGDPWIDQTADLLSSELRQSGIAVVLLPEADRAAMDAAAAADSYDVALVTRQASAFQTATANWYSDGQGPAGTAGTENWSRFDDPQVDQLFLQASEDLNPVTGSSVYGQIDDQLWAQMVALPLFGLPALLANGVQVANVQYNPSSDGLLWNAALWTTMKPGPTARQS